MKKSNLLAVRFVTTMRIMMNKKHWIAAVMVIFLPAAGIFSLSLENLLPENQVRQLLQSGVIETERFDSASLGLAPRSVSLERLLETAKNSINPNIVCESLRLYRKPSSAESWNALERTELYNGILAVSTLTGLEYFSKSRNRMRLFYEASTVIDGPETKNPRPDPVFRIPPAELSIFARQKDLTFGDNIYKFTYYSHESSFFILLENVNVLSYGPINVIGKNNLKSVFAVFDCGPYLLVYAASFSRASMLPGMKNRVGASLSNRADALLSWFTQKADRVFGKTL